MNQSVHRRSKKQPCLVGEEVPEDQKNERQELSKQEKSREMGGSESPEQRAG